MRWLGRILSWLRGRNGLGSAERGSTPLVAATSAGELPAGVREAEGRAARAEERAAQSEERAKEAAERATRAEERLGQAGVKTREAEQEAERLRVRCEEAERRLAEAEAARARTEADRAKDEERRRREDRASHPGLAEVWWSPGDACLAAITRQIERARRTIEVCVFTVTDDRIANALLAAHRRSVKVRLVTDNDKSSDLGSDVARLARAGIEVRVDRTEYHMHHKFAVFDGVRALTGSYNWTRGAARDNEEHIVVTDDARIVGALSRGFEDLWQKFA